MSFQINQIQQNGLEITELKNDENKVKLQVLPGSGALWHGWLFDHNGKEINLIDHYQNEADIKQNLSDSYKSAKLSPFACRIPEGKYSYEGKQYEFVKKHSDGTAIHGLLFNKLFRQGEVNQDDEKISVSFHYSYRHEDAGYPFDYDCTITYTLHQDGGVTLETRVKNTLEDTIPMMDGWHPYFTTGSKVNDCTLQFFSKEVVEFDENLIPTGRLLPYHEFEQERKLEDTDLDHSFLLDEKAPQPRCTFSDPQKNIQLQIFPSENYPVLQIYTPPHRNSIAIETLSGAPDAFNNGIGLVLLSPGEEKIFSVTYKTNAGFSV